MSAADRIIGRTSTGAVRVVTGTARVDALASRRASNTAASRNQSARARKIPAAPAGPTPAKAAPITLHMMVPVEVEVDLEDDVPDAFTEVLHEPAPEVPDLADLLPKRNGSRQAWAETAAQLGVPVEESMSRNDIVDAVEAHLSPDRMSQPAREGGRLASPEDEPVSEDVRNEDPGI